MTGQAVLPGERGAVSKDKVKEADGAGGDAEVGPDGEPIAGKKKLDPKILIIAAAAAVLVLGGGGAGAYFLFLKPKPAEHAEAGAHDEKAKEKDKKKKKGGDHEKGGKPEPGAATVKEGPDGIVFYTLPDIVVNMQTADGRPTFLKLKLTLELPDEELVEELDPALPRVNDMFQTFLREMRPEDLSGSQGSYQLRMEILRRINLLVAPSKVNAVLIEEMLIN
jgi:flagellar FliL protein